MLRIHQINRFSEMKRVRFQRNCGTASVEEYNRIICFYQLSWLCKFATVKSWKADVLETLYGDQFTLSTQLIKNKLSNFQRWPNKVNTERFLIYHNLGTEEKKLCCLFVCSYKQASKIIGKKLHQTVSLLITLAKQWLNEQDERKKKLHQTVSL